MVRGILILVLLALPAAARGSSTAGPAQWNAIDGGLPTTEALFGDGGTQATRGVGDENSLGKSAEQRAERIAALNDQIATDHNNLGQRLRALDQQPFPSPAERQQARNNLLAQSYQPPKEFRDATASLGLRSNRDLHEKAEAVQKRLSQEMSKQVEAARNHYQRAQQGAAAGDQFRALDTKAKEVRERMASMPEVRAAGAEGKTASPNLDGAMPAVDTSASSGETPRIGGFKPPAGDSSLSGKQGAVPADAPSAPLAGNLTPKEKPKMSLRDILKAKLAAAKLGGRREEAQRLEGELAQAEHEELRKLEGASRALASLTVPGKETHPPFSMNGEAGDVDRIVGAFERGSGEDGSAVSLFERVKRRYDACVVANRVGG